MIVYFNTDNGHIEKESEKGLGNVSMTVDEARAAWQNPGTIEDCNLAFRRLAIDFDFDVAACLKWYRDERKKSAKSS